MSLKKLQAFLDNFEDNYVGQSDKDFMKALSDKVVDALLKLEKRIKDLEKV